MKILLRKKSTFVYLWAIVLIILTAAIVILWQRVIASAQELRRIEQSGQILPQQQAMRAQLQQELTKHSTALTQLQQAVLTQDRIPEFVARLEAEARRHQVVTRVADVQEEIKLDKEGKPIKPSGPIREIRFKVLTIGTPGELVEWLHGVEHLPYLLTIPSWQLATETITAFGDGGLPVPTASPTPNSPLPGQITADILVSISHEAL